MKRTMTALAVATLAMIGITHMARADELDDIKKAGKIRIAIDLGVPPYGMTDEKLQPTGLDVETAQALAKDWGLQFEHVPTTGASRIPSLQTGKADLVISSLSYTAERAKVGLGDAAIVPHRCSGAMSNDLATLEKIELIHDFERCLHVLLHQQNRQSLIDEQPDLPQQFED